MADYLTQTILENAFGAKRVIELTDDAGTGAVVTAVLDGVIAAAEADVNACLNKGYTLPITVVDHGQAAYDTVVQLCVRVARYHLYSRRPEMIEPDGYIVNDYKAALELAIEMSKGTRAMPGTPPVQRSSPEAPAASIESVTNLSVDDRPEIREWTRESQG